MRSMPAHWWPHRGRRLERSASARLALSRRRAAIASGASAARSPRNLPGGSITATSPRTAGTFLTHQRGNTTTMSRDDRRHEQQADDEALVHDRGDELAAGHEPDSLTLCFMPGLLRPPAVRLARNARDRRSPLTLPPRSARRHPRAARRASSMRAGATAAASRAITPAGSVPGTSVIR